jgi:hypothetical protein
MKRKRAFSVGQPKGRTFALPVMTTEVMTGIRSP